MALHHRHQHARRSNFWDQLAHDANAAATALDLPAVFQEHQQKTSTMVVFVTQSVSNTQDIIGWRTLTTPEPTPAPTPTAAPTHATTAPALVVDTSSEKHSTTEKAKTSTGLPQSIAPPSSTNVNDNGLLVATNSQDLPSSTLAPTNTSTNTAVAKSSGGISAGGEAGLAIGILCLLGTIAGIVFFCIKKRRDAKREKLDDEKQEVWGGPERQPSTRPAPNAPRLSLRPVTQFLPNLGGAPQNRGNAVAMSNAPAPHRPNSWELPGTSQEGNRQNPFGNHAETIDAANASGPPVVAVVSPQGEIVTAAAAAAAGAAGAATLTRGASKRENGGKAMDLTTKNPTLPPLSPVGTEFSMSSESNGPSAPTPGAAAIAAAGGPPNSTVHRVQLDFKPSMDDELELRAGQLIRLLHEYDDGWALCIRLDRSAQGVVPRTCLSVRPVKPRPPQNGPRGPPPPGMRGPPGQPRPMSPGMNQGRPMSPAMAQGRMSPAMNQGGRMSPAMNQGGRMSPAQGRPASPSQRPNGPPYPQGPNGQGRPRSPSASQIQERRTSPPGPSRMNPAASASAGPGPQVSPQTSPVGRKPVPGQAM